MSRLHGGVSAHRVPRLRTRIRRWKARCTKGGGKPCDAFVVDGKAPPDISALKPYWVKPAVRDFRGSGGDGGIIRSPVRATALPGKPEGVRSMPENRIVIESPLLLSQKNFR